MINPTTHTTSIFLLSILIMAYSPSFSQTDTEIDAINLPALENLLDSAYQNSPLLKSQELLVQQKKIMTSIEKKSWMNALSFNSNYSQGTNNAQTEGVVIPSYTKTSSAWYNAGLSFNISLSTLLNRKNSISISKINQEIEQNNLEEGKSILKKLLFDLYTKVILDEKKLKIRNQAAVFSNLNFSYAEIEYKNNTITLAEFTKIHESKIKSNINYEEAKRNFKLSIVALEELVGIKLN